MSLPDLKYLLSLPVGLYLGGVILTQVLLVIYRSDKTKTIHKRRSDAGLDDEILVDHSTKLGGLRTEAIVDAAVLLATVVIFPFILAGVFTDEPTKPREANVSGEVNALGAVFLALLLWVLISATSVIKAFLGGIAFRAYVGIQSPFQVGDRVTMAGYSGKVEDIGPFFVRLRTLDDDLVSIPTASLWNAPIVSTNAGSKSSLCVMTFHLNYSVPAEKRQVAEDAIWNAIQSSVYWDYEKPMQIYLGQNVGEIVLTARAHVASTYNEPLFKSDVYQAFLDCADKEKIPLAKPA